MHPFGTNGRGTDLRRTRPSRPGAWKRRPGAQHEHGARPGPPLGFTFSGSATDSPSGGSATTHPRRRGPSRPRHRSPHLARRGGGARQARVFPPRLRGRSQFTVEGCATLSQAAHEVGVHLPHWGPLAAGQRRSRWARLRTRHRSHRHQAQRFRTRHEAGPGARSGTVSAGVLSGKPLPRSQGTPRARDQGTPRARHHGQHQETAPGATPRGPPRTRLAPPTRSPSDTGRNPKDGAGPAPPRPPAASESSALSSIIAPQPTARSSAFSLTASGVFPHHGETRHGPRPQRSRELT
jgi:hypothetical protein